MAKLYYDKDADLSLIPTARKDTLMPSTSETAVAMFASACRKPAPPAPKLKRTASP